MEISEISVLQCTMQVQWITMVRSLSVRQKNGKIGAIVRREPQVHGHLLHTGTAYLSYGQRGYTVLVSQDCTASVGWRPILHGKRSRLCYRTLPGDQFSAVRGHGYALEDVAQGQILHGKRFKMFPSPFFTAPQDTEQALAPMSSMYLYRRA